MTPIECAHEDETLAVVLAGRWPDACEQELRSHVETCGACAEVVAIAAAFRADRDLTRTAPVPSAAHVWWRGTGRLRADAGLSASRPIVWMQAGAAAAVGGVALAYVSHLSIATSVGIDVIALIAPPLLITGATMILATPLAVLLAFRNT